MTEELGDYSQLPLASYALHQYGQMRHTTLLNYIMLSDSLESFLSGELFSLKGAG